jgi:AraC-like DNA-binding protein
MQQELIRLVSEARDIDQFIDELSDIVSSEMDAATKKPTQSSEDLIELAIAHVDASLRDSQLSLTTVSGMLGVSPNYLSRVFHEVKNTTFINYVSTAKIKLGCKMLLESKKTLREISEELNYASPQYFISRFKNQFGVTPSVYRHKNTSDNAHT